MADGEKEEFLLEIIRKVMRPAARSCVWFSSPHFNVFVQGDVLVQRNYVQERKRKEKRENRRKKKKVYERKEQEHSTRRKNKEK